MALTGPFLSSLLLRDHLSIFPDAIDATRENPETGVPKHIVIVAFLDALCEVAGSAGPDATARVATDELCAGMVLLEDLCMPSGPLVFRRGTTPRPEILRKIHTLSAVGELSGEVQVLSPALLLPRREES